MILIAAAVGLYLGGLSFQLDSVERKIEGSKYHADAWMLSMGVLAVC